MMNRRQFVKAGIGLGLTGLTASTIQAAVPEEKVEVWHWWKIPFSFEFNSAFYYPGVQPKAFRIDTYSVLLLTKAETADAVNIKDIDVILQDLKDSSNGYAGNYAIGKPEYINDIYDLVEKSASATICADNIQDDEINIFYSRWFDSKCNYNPKIIKKLKCA